MNIFFALNCFWGTLALLTALIVPGGTVLQPEPVNHPSDPSKNDVIGTPSTSQPAVTPKNESVNVSLGLTTAHPPITTIPTTTKAPSEVSDMASKNGSQPNVIIHSDTREEDVRHSNEAHSRPQPFRHESPDIFMPDSPKTYGSPTAAAYAAGVCIFVAVIFYGSIIAWKRFAENRERNRGMLLTDDDMADLNDPDLRVFETASLQIEV